MKPMFIVILIVLLLPVLFKAQEPEELVIKKDTMVLTGQGIILNGDYIEATLKNLSTVRFFKTNNNKYYMRFLVTVNFYFNKVDMLEIRSGKKSYYNENTKQFKVNKNKGLFIIEIPHNYVTQLKEEGITSIVFGKAETGFTKQDASRVRKIATLFHELITAKKIN